MKRDIRMERMYPHPPELVWKALTDGNMLAEWFTANTFQPVVGHRFQFKTDPGPDYDGILYCEVKIVEPPHRLAYTFRGGWMQSETLVTWTLTPHEGGTQATFSNPVGERRWTNCLLSLRSRWRTMRKQLNNRNGTESKYHHKRTAFTLSHIRSRIP